MSASQAVVDADLARFATAFEAADAIRTEPDGFQWVDETRVPAHLLAAYRRLITYAAANGLLPTMTSGATPADRSTT